MAFVDAQNLLEYIDRPTLMLCLKMAPDFVLSYQLSDAREPRSAVIKWVGSVRGVQQGGQVEVRLALQALSSDVRSDAVFMDALDKLFRSAFDTLKNCYNFGASYWGRRI